jgi:hypothetical protein
MRLRKLLPSLVVFVMVFSSVAVFPASAAPASQSVTTFTRTITTSGAASFAALPAGSAAFQTPEIAGGFSLGKAPTRAGGSTSIVNRSFSRQQGTGVSIKGANENNIGSMLKLSFQGLDLYQQRTANGGNQYTVEPPDQGLCVGNGFVMESLNDVIRVYDTSGNALMGVVDMNTFYGYPAAIDRSKPAGEARFGPFITDPTCLYDRASGRWFQVVLTLDVDPVSGDFLGTNHLDIAVSNTSSPLGTWRIWRLPTQNDGTQGTPNHGCSLGPCLADYPHIGANLNGFYVTTNEYSFSGPEFKSANVYAFSKFALEYANSATVVEFATPTADNGKPGFSLAPATAPGFDDFGTEYFLSSTAADEVTCPSGCTGPGTSNYILVWKLSNTWTLDFRSPRLFLTNRAVKVGTYSTPPKSTQKAGDYPLGQSLGDPLGILDSNDTRMLQTTYEGGNLWAALDTAVNVGGATKAGIEWFIVNPRSTRVSNQGYLGLENNNLTYPAVGVNRFGQSVIAFTVVGADYYPSAGYASLNSFRGTGDVQIAGMGAGPQDGFTEYSQYTNRPRWGDYGAAVADGSSIWIASEYIGQTCTLAQYAADNTCGGTRAPLGNWATRISLINP